MFMATGANTPEFTTADDMLEAQVMQQEELLDSKDAAAKQRGSSEGVRHQVYLEINGELVPVIDQPEELKYATATDAVNKRAEAYEEETYRLAEFKLGTMNVVEAVDLIRELSPGDREIYLRAEKKGKNRESIFKVFGHPEGE